MSDEFERKSHVMLKRSYMIVTGELTLGYTFYGPFENPAKAGQWARDNLKKNVFHRIHELQDVR